MNTHPESQTNPSCDLCRREDKACRSPEGNGPDFCPTVNETALIEEVCSTYQNPEICNFAQQASIQEAEGYGKKGKDGSVRYPVKPRIQEVCEFATKMKYKKLGVAFCAGLHAEAKMACDVFRAQGFEVVSVVCKVGGLPKEMLGLEEAQKIMPHQYESMCNPILQAKVLNHAKTEFNVLVGLCVGHDSLFFKYADAMTTVLVAKDRLLGHNPVAALYTSGSYYSGLKYKDCYDKMNSQTG